MPCSVAKVAGTLRSILEMASPIGAGSRLSWACMSPLRKRRTRQHVIADLSVNHVERLILRCGWAAQRMSPDYGIDLYMETYGENGEVENDGVWFQLKATENIKLTKRRMIPVRLEWRDLLYWLNEWRPGILVIYDASQDRAWWLHLQRALRAIRLKIGEPPAETVTFHIPLANILDEAAIREFAKLRDAAVVAKGGSPW